MPCGHPVFFCRVRVLRGRRLLPDAWHTLLSLSFLTAQSTKNSPDGFLGYSGRVNAGSGRLFAGLWRNCVSPLRPAFGCRSKPTGPPLALLVRPAFNASESCRDFQQFSELCVELRSLLGRSLRMPANEEMRASAAGKNKTAHRRRRAVRCASCENCDSREWDRGYSSIANVDTIICFSSTWFGLLTVMPNSPAGLSRSVSR